jgi:hypothetical protein
MSTPNITVHHGAMPQGSVNLQARLAAPQGGAANQTGTHGNPVFTSFQPANPNVIPNPSIEQLQIIGKALKMLNSHQLLMKFATENKQVC